MVHIMSKMPMVGVRLNTEQIAAIDALIEEGEFEDRSEFIRYAVRKHLKTYHGRGQTPPPQNRLKGGIDRFRSLPS